MSEEHMLQTFQYIKEIKLLGNWHMHGDQKL